MASKNIMYRIVIILVFSAHYAYLSLVPYHGCVNFLCKVFQKYLCYIQSRLPINIDGIEPGMKKCTKDKNWHFNCFFLQFQFHKRTFVEKGKLIAHT